jgi:hypothetical protein
MPVMWLRYWQKTLDRDMKEASKSNNNTDTTAADPS